MCRKKHSHSHDSSPNRDNLSFCFKTHRITQVTRSYTIGAAVKIPEGATMANLDNALQELRGERNGTQLRLEKLDQVISAIESLNGTGVSSKSGRLTRIVPAASRRKMAFGNSRGRLERPRVPLPQSARCRHQPAGRSRRHKRHGGRRSGRRRRRLLSTNGAGYF
jgi:hypothetical protein